MRFTLWLCALPAFAASCEPLASLSLPDANITLAQQVEAGAFPGDAFKDLPAFCRVAATLKPSDDSDIKIEIWMPASGWNNKFAANGNGGWTSSINYNSLAA